MCESRRNGLLDRRLVFWGRLRLGFGVGHLCLLKENGQYVEYSTIFFYFVLNKIYNGQIS